MRVDCTASQILRLSSSVWPRVCGNGQAAHVRTLSHKGLTAAHTDSEPHRQKEGLSRHFTHTEPVLLRTWPTVDSLMELSSTNTFRFRRRCSRVGTTELTPNSADRNAVRALSRAA